MLKCIGIIVNLNKDITLDVTRLLIELLEKRGIEPLLFGDVAEKLGRPVINRATFFNRSNAIFVLGGDGTMLGVIAEASIKGKPVMGINMGRLGFLSEIEISEINDALDVIAAGDYKIDQRMMLECRVHGKTFYALNEISVHRAVYERIIRLDVFAGDIMADSFYADGLIIASPTGSTAYSLSAGGPVLSPSLSAMLLTPVCAHTLRSRPIVFPDNEIIKIRVVADADVSIIYDSMEQRLNENHAEITVTRAPFDAKFLTVKNRNFYKLLNSKLNEWSISGEDKI